MTKRKLGRPARPSPEPRILTSSERTNPIFDWVLALGAAIYGLAIVLTSGHPRPTAWGLDTPGYLAPPLRATILVLIGVGAVLLILAALIGKGTPSAVLKRPDQRSRWSHWSPWILLFVYAGTLWALRVRSYFLGDQMVWLDNIRASQFPLYSEPLASLVWRGYVMLLRAVGIPVTNGSLALLPTLCGVAAAVVAWRIARFMAPDPTGRLITVALFLTLGTTQLYCGYVESYSVVTLAILFYVLAALRLLNREGSSLLLGLSLVIAVATHLAALYLVPSYVMLVLLSPSSWTQRIGLLLLPIITAFGMAWLLAVDLSDLMRPFQVLSVALRSAAHGTGHPISQALLVARPIGELTNLVLLVMPIPALVIASRVLSWPSQRWHLDPVSRFLTAAAIPGLLVASALVLPGSPAQDWDLLSVMVLPTALLGVLLASSNAKISSSLVRAGLALLALTPLLAFVLVNANEHAGARRFKTIIDPSAILSAHERAYANEKLVKYYTARKDFDSVFVYAQRAHAAEPANTRYLGNVGTALYNLHRYEEAAHYFEEAIRAGSDRAEAYYNLGLCYMREGRYQEALANFRTAVEIAGERPKLLNSLAMALLATGNPRAARSTWIYVTQRWPDFQPAARALRYYFGQ